jgi:hypothetical protein
MLRRRHRVPILLAALGTIMGCGSNAVTGSSPSGLAEPSRSAPTEMVSRLTLEYLLACDDVDDWAANGDAFVTLTVTVIRRIEPSPEDAKRTEGVLIGQIGTATVDSVFWQKAGALAPPKTLEFAAGGWLVADGKETKMAWGSSPVFAVGRTYAVLLAHFSEGWAPLCDGDTIAEIGSDGRILVPDEDPKAGFSPSGGLVYARGKTPEEFAQLLKGASG